MITRLPTSVFALLLAAVLAFSACDSAGPDARPESQFNATLHVTTPEAEQTVDYEGTGLFGIMGKLRPKAPMPDGLRGFFLHSATRGAASAQQFNFYGPGDERPSEGTYVIGEEGFRVTYERAQGNQWQVFSAESGEIEITTSTEERVEGRFELTGRLTQTCERIGRSGRRCKLGGDGADASIQIDARGTFEAVPRGQPLPR